MYCSNCRSAQGVYGRTTYRFGVSVSILNLASTMNDKINKHLVVSAPQLLQSFPMDPTNNDKSETTLITRYIVPLLLPLLDNDDLNIQLDFTGTELAEKCKRPPNFNGCPDCIISRFSPNKWRVVFVGIALTNSTIPLYLNAAFDSHTPFIWH